jgi:hypothetical protein
VHRALTANVLSTGELSDVSRIALHRRNLTETYRTDPETTLRTLRGDPATAAISADDLFVLAEVSFHHAGEGGGKPHYLAAAVYAYAFVFPNDPEQTPNDFDPRQRVAMDIYNRALTEALSTSRSPPAATRCRSASWRSRSTSASCSGGSGAWCASRRRRRSR